MTVLLNSTYTGNDGDPWPSPWTTSFVGGSVGGANEIFGNRGRLQARDGDYTVSRADATGITVANVLIEGSIRFPVVAAQSVYIWGRSGGWDVGDPSAKSNAYFLLLRMGYDTYDQVSIGEYTQGTRTVLDTYLFDSFLTGIDYNFKFDLNVSTLQAKVWNPIDTEPNWQVSVTDNSHSDAGGIAVSLESGPAGAAREINVDNFVVTSTEALDIQPSYWSSPVEVITVIDPATPNRQIFRWDGSQLVPVDFTLGV